MSINIHFEATREIIVVATGQRDTQTIIFNALQTPTRVTNEILRSADPVATYVDWVLRECSDDQIDLIYADDDIFEEFEPIGKETWNAGKEHAAQFQEWVSESQSSGYLIVASEG